MQSKIKPQSRYEIAFEYYKNLVFLPIIEIITPVNQGGTGAGAEEDPVQEEDLDQEGARQLPILQLGKEF